MQIEIRDLSKSYGKTIALRNVSLTIEQGMFGLLGPNGAGKSTLMRIISSLLEPTSGHVLVNGLRVAENKREIRRMLGYLPQEFGLYKRLNAMEFLDLVADLKQVPRGKGRRREIEQVLKQVNMWESRKQRAGGYSGGMKRRMGIAQALLGDPRLLIVDEPTAGLDPQERTRFRNLLTELSGERIVILSTHIVADIENSCNRLAILDRGKLAFVGEQKALINKANGQVWEGIAREGELEGLRKRVQIVSTKKVDGNYLVRYIGARLAVRNAKPVAATLEDGYMVTVLGGGYETVME